MTLTDLLDRMHEACHILFDDLYFNKVENLSTVWHISNELRSKVDVPSPSRIVNGK